MFYSHRTHESNGIIIPSIMGTCQNDPLKRALFTLAHFKALRFITNHFPSCLFSSIANDTHIISPPFIISSTYEHFKIKLNAINLSILPHKCVAWSPCGLLFDFNTPSKFTTPSKKIRILGVPLGISSFTSSFVKDAMLEDVRHVKLSLEWVMFK